MTNLKMSITEKYLILSSINEFISKNVLRQIADFSNHVFIVLEYSMDIFDLIQHIATKGTKYQLGIVPFLRKRTFHCAKGCYPLIVGL